MSGGRRRPARPGPRRSTGPDPARRLAYDALRAVDTRDAYANLVLPGMLRGAGLEPRDAALATELVYGTLRARGRLDAVLARCSARPLDAVDPPLLDVLRLGAYQLLATRVPPHAAVATAVDLARVVAGEGAARFANAVLRRVGERDGAAWDAVLAPPGTDPRDRLALVHSHPRWVVDAFADALGEGAATTTAGLAETAAALAADNARPGVTLVARAPDPQAAADVAALVAAGGAPGRWSARAVAWPGGDVTDLPGVRAGVVGVQDEGSQLVTLAAAAAPLAGADRAWLDLCAGPGGKAALLTGLAAGRGAVLLAGEPTAHRAGLVAAALAPLVVRGATSAVVVADGRAGAWRAGAFDRVLADVPCTGLGALRRRPEARWRRGPADVGRLAALQADLLTAALDAARPGGLVAYVTCSPHRGETTEVLATVRARRDATAVDARPLLPGLPDLGPGPTVQLWPHRHGTDAMFLALLRRG